MPTATVSMTSVRHCSDADKLEITTDATQRPEEHAKNNLPDALARWSDDATATRRCSVLALNSHSAFRGPRSLPTSTTSVSDRYKKVVIRRGQIRIRQPTILDEDHRARSRDSEGDRPPKEDAQMNVPAVPLGELADVESGRTIQALHEPSFFVGDIPWVKQWATCSKEPSLALTETGFPVYGANGVIGR